MFLVLTACGGGGDSTPAAPITGSGMGSSPTTPAPSEPSAADFKAAALMLDLATFGATGESLDAVANAGSAAWLDEQLELPPS